MTLSDQLDKFITQLAELDLPISNHACAVELRLLQREAQYLKARLDAERKCVPA